MKENLLNKYLENEFKKNDIKKNINKLNENLKFILNKENEIFINYFIDIFINDLLKSINENDLKIKLNNNLINNYNLVLKNLNEKLNYYESLNILI